MQFKQYKELLSIDNKGLHKELAEAVKYLNVISFENSQGNLKDTSQLRKVRRYTAWIRTIENSRELEQPSKQAAEQPTEKPKVTKKKKAA